MAEDRRKQQQHEQQNQHQQDAVSTEYLVHNWLEAMFAWFQVIILWHEPRVSLYTISGLLSSFLLLTYFAPRFYATIMIAIFIYNLNKFWFRHVWPEIRVPPENDRELEQRLDVDRWTLLHPQLMTLKELRYHIRNLKRLAEFYLQQFLLLRQRKPTHSCLLLCSVFSFAAYLGSMISGMSLVFFTLATIMSAPGIYVHLLSDHYKILLQQHLQSFMAAHQLDASTDKPQHELNDYADHSDKQETLKSALRVSKDTVATSLTSTIRSIESLIDNIKGKTPVAVVTAIPPETSSPQPEPEPTVSMLSNLREDGARALFNLVDVTLFGSNRDRQKQQTLSSDDSHTETQGHDHQRKRTSCNSTEVDESISLINQGDDQQDEGFVML